MNLKEASSAVRQTIEKYSQEISAVGEHVWKNPEPGYREVETSAYLAKKIEELGLNVTTGLAVTGFRADIDTGRPGPVLAVLGELDSLILPNHPECDKKTGAVHACGHNASCASLYGTAVGLLKSGVLDSMCGKIALIASPAEEGIEMDYRKSLIDQGKIGSIAGKSQLIREGVFDDVDLSYMHHLSSRFAYNDHNGCVNKKIIFRGKSCHAARPQDGINALNASTLALNAIAMLRESYSNDPYIRIHGIITNGGDTVNIIPDEVTMDYMLRAPSLESILNLNDRFDHAVMYAAKAAECEAIVETLNGYMPLLDDEELGALIGSTAEELFPGIKYDYNSTFFASCTDMGDIATVLPAVHGYTPGCGGIGHGANYCIANPQAAYVDSSLLSATVALKLLHGDAAPAKKIAEKKKDLLPIPEYIKIIDKINMTRSSNDL
ncbi:MAG: amidohydrolase [Lentisphaerae bacterium]|nr:amidohydrolase [Lentisphaerota bacterium]